MVILRGDADRRAATTPIGCTCKLPVNVVVQVAHIFIKQRLLQHTDVRLQLQILITRRYKPPWNIVKAVKKEVRRDQMAQREEKEEEGNQFPVGGRVTMPTHR